MTADRRPRCSWAKCVNTAEVSAEVVGFTRARRDQAFARSPKDFGFRKGRAEFCTYHLAEVCEWKPSDWDVVVVPYLLNGKLRRVKPQPGCTQVYRLVCQGNDSEIEHLTARWAGCYEAWRASTEMRSQHFIRDVVEKCGVPVRVRQRRWDQGLPGLSGVWYKVSTTSKPELKEAIRARLDEFVAQLRGR